MLDNELIDLIEDILHQSRSEFREPCRFVVGLGANDRIKMLPRMYLDCPNLEKPQALELFGLPLARDRNLPEFSVEFRDSKGETITSIDISPDDRGRE